MKNKDITLEQRREKFLKEHPNFEFWQMGQGERKYVFEKELKYKIIKIDKFIYSNYFKNVPKTIKIEAQQKLYVNRRSGKIKKQNCKKCGEQKTVAHHEDYSKPLDVIWLCVKHHFERHKELNKFKIHNKEFKLEKLSTV